MNARRSRGYIAVVTVCCLCLPSVLAKKPGGGGGNGGGGGDSGVTYEVVQLETFEASAVDINETGAVVGGGNGVPLHWQVTAGETTSVVAKQLSLGNSSATRGFAYAINDNGAICGGIYNDDFSYDAAVLWGSADADPIVLSTGAGAQDVNNHGIVVGSLGTSAAAWHVDGDGVVVGPVLLGPGIARSINDSNLVVGADGTGSGSHAVAWLLDWYDNNLSVVTQWPVIDASGLDWSTAMSVNEAGDIVGGFQVPGNYPEAFYVDVALEPQSLPSLVDNRKKYTVNQRAYDINNASPPQVPGYALVLDRKYGGQQTGSGQVIWQGDSVLAVSDITVPSPIAPLNLNALNDAGWLAGQGSDAAGTWVPIVMIAR